MTLHSRKAKHSLIEGEITFLPLTSLSLYALNLSTFLPLSEPHNKTLSKSSIEGILTVNSLEFPIRIWDSFFVERDIEISGGECETGLVHATVTIFDLPWYFYVIKTRGPGFNSLSPFRLSILVFILPCILFFLKDLFALSPHIYLQSSQQKFHQQLL